MRIRTVLPIVVLIALGPVLAGCESFDLDSLDIFGLSDKKKLPGERKALFPEGVPGVTQGIPPELVKGSPAQTEAAAEAAKPPEEPKPAPKPRKPKPRVVRAPATPAATRVTVQPRGKQEQQSSQGEPAQTNTQTQTGTNAPWPSNNAQQPSQWPSSPAPGTFQR